MDSPSCHSAWCEYCPVFEGKARILQTVTSDPLSVPIIKFISTKLTWSPDFPWASVSAKTKSLAFTLWQRKLVFATKVRTLALMSLLGSHTLVTVPPAHSHLNSRSPLLRSHGYHKHTPLHHFQMPACIFLWVCPQRSTARYAVIAFSIHSPSLMACQHRKWAGFPAAFQSIQIWGCEGAHILVFMPVKALGMGLAPAFTPLHGVACCTARGWLEHGCCRHGVQAPGACCGSVGRRSHEAGSSLGVPRAAVWTGTLDQRPFGLQELGCRETKAENLNPGQEFLYRLKPFTLCKWEQDTFCAVLYFAEEHSHESSDLLSWLNGLLPVKTLLYVHILAISLLPFPSPYGWWPSQGIQ